MKTVITPVALAGLMLLAACGGKGDDKLGDQAEQAMDNRADQVDAQADNASGATKEALENQADALRDEGDRKEEAIDASDVDAHGMNDAQKNAVVNGM